MAPIRGRPSKKKIMEQSGQSSETSKFLCEFCNRPFPRNKSLNSHIRIHTGVKPFDCTYPGCDKLFKQSGHLNTHYWTHTGERAFVCPECKERFAHSNRKCNLHPDEKLIRDYKEKIKVSENSTPAEVAWLNEFKGWKKSKKKGPFRPSAKSLTVPYKVIARYDGSQLRPPKSPSSFSRNLETPPPPSSLPPNVLTPSPSLYSPNTVTPSSPPRISPDILTPPLSLRGSSPDLNLPRSRQSTSSNNNHCSKRLSFSSDMSETEQTSDHLPQISNTEISSNSISLPSSSNRKRKCRQTTEATEKLEAVSLLMLLQHDRQEEGKWDWQMAPGGRKYLSFPLFSKL